MCKTLPKNVEKFIFYLKPFCIYKFIIVILCLLVDKDCKYFKFNLTQGYNKLCTWYRKTKLNNTALPYTTRQQLPIGKTLRQYFFICLYFSLSTKENINTVKNQHISLKSSK